MTNVVKQLKSLAAHSGAFSRFLDVIERPDRRRQDLLRVLMYHRIDDPAARPTLHPAAISATPQAFEEQVRYLADHFNVVSCRQVLNAFAGEEVLPPKAVLITFDDAYRDFDEHAWRILKRHGLPATLFVATEFSSKPERGFWWDRLHHAIATTPRRDRLTTPCGELDLATADDRHAAYEQLNVHVKTLPHGEAMVFIDRLCEELESPPLARHVLNWDELRRLAGEGVTLGAHTRTHPLMHRVSVEDARAEAEGSLADLRREIGDVPPIFAYPGGRFNQAVVEALRGAGFVLAFATRRGINDLRSTDPLRIRRVHVGRGTTREILRAKLSYWTLYLNRWRPVSG